MKVCVLLLLSVMPFFSPGQTCPAATDDENAYGTDNQWIGHVYNNADFTNYYGATTEGTAASPNFDEGFGGDLNTFSTSGCGVYAETFSVRYKLQQFFFNSDYEITVGGDDGYRLSVDGGTTWLVSDWTDHNYTSQTVTVHLNGLTQFVLEYYENTLVNRVTFNIQEVCSGTGDQTQYGTNNQWIGYVYGNNDFTDYKGRISKGSISSPSFYEEFGTADGYSSTDQCPFIAQTFAVRFKLRKHFSAGNYSFTAGGDDGYRLSLDGGNSWVIDNFEPHSYVTSDYTVFLDGTYDMVLEYYDINGGNIVSFDQKDPSLPLNLVSFSARRKSNDQNQLQWIVSSINKTKLFEIEKSIDGHSFKKIDGINPANALSFNYIDNFVSGISFYRLKLLGFDNSYSYSPVCMVGEKGTKKLIVFPNPIQNKEIRFCAPSASALLITKLYDNLGRLIQNNSCANVSEGQIINLKLSPLLAKGTYLFICTDNNGNRVKQRIAVQ